MKYIILIAAIFCWTCSFGQNVSELKLSNRQSILSNRAFLVFPANAKNEARPTDIMAAGPNGNRETRILLDIAKQRMVFFAKELFVTSQKDLLKQVSNQEGHSATNKVLTNKEGLLTVLSTPGSCDTTEDAILMNKLYVRCSDNSVFMISTYINPEGLRNKKEFQELSERVFSTITKGDRLLNLKSRTESFPIFNGKKKFTISLPTGYAVTKDKSFDFEVLRIQKIKDIADTNWLGLTIYTGDHPSYFYGDYGFEEDQAENVNGRFLGKNVEWLYFKKFNGTLYLKEQEIPCDNIEKGLIVHIAMEGNKTSAIKELTDLVENIRLTEK